MTETLLSQTLQKLQILKEAAQSRALSVIDVGDAAEQGYGLRQAAAAFGLASLQAGMLQLYALSTPKGTPHFYGQAFDGRTPLPGEHHIVLPFGVPAAASFVDGFTGGSWSSSDPELQRALRKHRSSSILLGASFDWRIGAGSVKRSWLAQLRPTGNAQTHLVMKATGEGSIALDVRPVGFATFTQLVLSFAEQPLGAAPAAAAAVFPTTAQYTEAFAAFLTGEVPPNPTRANLAGRDLGPAIHQLLGAHAGGKLHVHPLPPKKEANARREVMPREAQALPLVAVIDLTLMGSATNAVAITPSHCFYREDDARLAFDWAEVRAVDASSPEHAYVRFRLAERGWITLRLGDPAPAFAALLHELARIPA